MFYFKLKFKLIICLIFGISISNISLAFSGKYPIKNFSPSEYKAGIQNIDFAQNRDMTIYVANNLGVLAYNGNDWETFNFSAGKKKRSLAFDQTNDRLYVGSQGEFGYLEKDWEYFSLLAKIPIGERDFDEVWDVFMVNSNVYFCTFRAIYKFDGENISVIKNEKGFSKSFFIDGKLFTQNQIGELFEINEDKLIPFTQKNSKGGIITGIIAENDGYLLFYESGEIVLSKSFGNLQRYQLLINTLNGKYVNHILKLSDTRIVISTQTSGIYIYDSQNQILENITQQEGLQSNVCLRAFQDYEGNLWVGMQNGIALIDIYSPLRLINQDLNLQGSGYQVFQYHDGTYYTTSSGIYFQDKEADKCTFIRGTEGPAYEIREIAGKLYAGHHTGLFLLNGNVAKKIAETEGLWKIQRLRSHPDYLIGGTYSGLYLFKLNDSEIVPLQKIDGFKESSRFFEEDQKGRIWVGQYYKGLFMLTFNDELTSVSINLLDNSLISNQEQILLSNIDNELYIGTLEGLYKLDQSKDNFNKVENSFVEIGNQPVYLFKQDSQNNIHVITENLVGFYKQISTNNYIFIPSSLFQLRYNLNNDLLNLSSSTESGLFFSANEGFIYYNPNAEYQVSTQTPIIIRDIMSVTQNRTIYSLHPFDQKPVSIGKIILNHREKVLKFNVESFQFNNLDNQQFQYFLKGFDKDFGEPTNITTKEYSNLREGTYTFIVKTSNYMGETSTSEPIVFKINPPYYRSTIAKIGYLVTGIAVLLFVVWFQKRRFQKHAEIIERQNQQELAEKQMKLEEVKKQKEVELLRLEEEKMESELMHVNGLLATSTMNLVAKNDFIQTIREELAKVNVKGENTEARRILEKIVKEIDNMLRINEDWEQFEHYFDLVHGDFLKRLREEFQDLTTSEQKLCAFLRLNLNTKDIANLMNISVRGVEISRYRLRKKLNLDKGQNLSKFILEY